MNDTEDNCPLISNKNQTDSDGDGIGNYCDSDFVFEVLEVSLDNSSVDENKEKGSFVGTLSGTDSDDEASITSMEMVDSLDSENFIIDGFNLLTNKVFDYESKSSYEIVIKAISSGDIVSRKYLQLLLQM